jgi:predicted dehydrogenase
VRFGIVGHGWRTDFYLRLARRAPERFSCVGVVTRHAKDGERLEKVWGVDTFRTPEQLLAMSPEVVVTSIPRQANPDVLRRLVHDGVAVLSETPPAGDLQELRRLWADVGESGLVQVAEQHPFLPIFTAVKCLTELGVLGTISSCVVSWSHDYHGTALLRRLLAIGGEPVAVQALHTQGSLMDGPDRDGWPADPQVRDNLHTLGVVSAGARNGVYDFSEGQWFNPLRRRHVVVRGSRGELVDDQITWSGDDGRPLFAPVVRRQTGVNGNLEGADLDTITWTDVVLYRNPYPGSRMSDEEIAIATCLEATGRWARGEGPPPYPLADACQAHLLGLESHRAAELGRRLMTDTEDWSAYVRADWDQREMVPRRLSASP